MSDQDNIFDAAERDTAMAVSAYALGQMSAREREAFEQRLEREPALAERLAEERNFIDDFRDALPAGTPPADGFDRLQLTSQEPRRTAPALMAAAVAMLAVGLVLLLPQEETVEQPAFETLSSDNPAVIEQAFRYRIVAQDGIDSDSLLAAYGLEIVESDGVAGSILAARATALDAQELSSLRQAPGVRLVELQYRGQD